MVEKKEEIRVLLVEPLERPKLVTMEHTLENLQKLVGGMLQAVYPWEDPVGLVCDDEGLFKGCPLNRALTDDDGNVYDIIKGTFFICGLGADDFCSLSDEMAEKYTRLFQYPEMFMRTMDGHVVWVRMGSGIEPKVIT